MNGFYNHIKHLVDTNDYGNSITIKCWHSHPEDDKHDANYLDDKQRHTGFDYHEYGMLKWGTPAWAQRSLNRSASSVNFQEHLEYLEHDQARH